MKALGYTVGTVSPTNLYKLFENNSGLITLSQYLDMRTRKKHINMKYHYFCAYVANSTISVLPIESSNQPVDMMKHLLN